jgi:serpin B
MMNLRVALLLLLVVLMACDKQPRAADKPAPAPPLSAAEQATVAATVSGINALAAKLYVKLKAAPGNLFFSPYSITTALGMAYEGAQGQTASEIQGLFGFPAEAGARHAAFGALHKHLNPSQASYKLSLANSFWAQQGFDFLPAYTAVLREHYSAEATNVDFAGATEATRQQINGWVDEQTAHRIPELFAAGMLTPDTVLALVNAIYFKGKWAEPFDPDWTQDREFRAPSGRLTVPMMSNASEYWYGANDKLQIVALPYEASALEMLVVLPKGDAISAAEEFLLSGELAKVKADNALETTPDGLRLSPSELTIMLPKFQFDAGYMLGDHLSALGMPTAFDPEHADFSGMDGRRYLYIGVVIHKAWVQVDEEGTEAAAATGVTMETTAAPADDPLVFNADHPFLFAIRDRDSGLILFVGRVEDPTRKS